MSKAAWTSAAQGGAACSELPFALWALSEEKHREKPVFMSQGLTSEQFPPVSEPGLCRTPLRACPFLVQTGTTGCACWCPRPGPAFLFFFLPEMNRKEYILQIKRAIWILIFEANLYEPTVVLFFRNCL